MNPGEQSRSRAGPARLLAISNDVVGPNMAGPGIRAWEIARAVHRAGFEVTLACPGDVAPEAPFATIAYDPRGTTLRAAAAEADAVFVQSLVLSHYPFLAKLEVPLVVDLYDPFILENLQGLADSSPRARARRHGSDLQALTTQLRRGDFFVCASEQQRDLWLGMLTAVGRVNPLTYSADATLRGLIDTLPFGLPDEAPGTLPPALKGVVPGIGSNDQVVLWGGGIWNWFDPATLVRAVAALAVDNPRLRLFFLGTKSPSPTVARMPAEVRARELARQLGLDGRTVFFNDGWVPYNMRAAYLAEADVGVSCHLPYVEARYAFRTRLLDYIWAGLPMVVTEGDVLADMVVARGLGEAIPPEDVPATSAALERVLAEATNPAGAARYAERFAAVRAELTWSRAVAPLVAFLEAPHLAADGSNRAEHGLDPVDVTPLGGLPRRAVEIARDDGPLMLVEEAVRYLRWLRRPR